MVTKSLTHWLSQFCSWHERFKGGTLGEDVLPSYMKARADLGAILVMAQRLDIRANHGTRQSVRVARAVPVEFDLRSGKASSLTRDISVNGLSALVGEAQNPGTLAPFRLRLDRNTQPIAGRCRVVANIPLQGSVRMAATFEDIPKDGRSRIETLVFDAICSEIRVMLRSEQSQESPAAPPPPRP
jgi:hypothetical protein